MATRLLGKRIITALLVLLVLVPASISYAQGRKVEKFIELAVRAKEKTETLINTTYANETAIETITGAGLYDELDANVTEFNKAVQNITNAQEIFQEDPEGAIANVTYALGIFREVFKAMNTILTMSGVQRGQLVDAQGLMQAMKRALDRIDRLEEIGELPIETSWLLGNATLYLNVTQALEWLQIGMVNQTAHNLTQANNLISQAHKTLKKTAAEMNTKRIQSYFRVIENLYSRLKQQVEKAIERDLDAETLNATLVTAIRPLIEHAQTLLDEEEYSEALEKLQEARDMLEQVEEDLKLLK